MKSFLLKFMPIIAILFLLSACNGNDDVSNEEGNELENNNEEAQPLDLRELSDEIIKALDSRDMGVVASHVDERKELLFSPYVYVTDEAVIFEKSEVASLLESNTKYVWGDYDGRGTPIELTPKEYFTEFFDMTYEDPDSVIENDPQHRGNTENNIRERFPEAEIIEYYNDGSEEYAGIDWSSVYLVYKKDDSDHLQLIAIIRDMWTI